VSGNRYLGVNRDRYTGEYKGSFWDCPECERRNAYDNRACRGCGLRHPGA